MSDASSSTGSEDPTGEGDGDGDDEPVPTTTTANDGSAMCEPGDVCVDDAIAGWDGPVAVYVGPADAPPPNCDGGVPMKVAEVYTDLQTNMSGDTCSCECGPVTDFACGAARLESSAQPNCAVTNGSWDLPAGECTDLGAALGSLSYRLDPAPLISATCQPSTSGPIEAAEHRDLVVACTMDAPQDCEGGVCMPPTDEAPWDGRVCIVAEGDVQCPTGSYGVRNVYYTGLTDERSCGACECDTPANATCEGKVNLLSNACGIQGLKLGEVATGDCDGPFGAGVEYGALDLDPYTGGCAPSGGGVNGEINETGAITFCCQ